MRAQDIHRRSVVVDGHCDTVHLFAGNTEIYDFSRHNQIGHIDLPRLKQGGVNIQFFAIYVEPEYKQTMVLQRALDLLEHFWHEMEKNKNDIMVIRTSGDLEECLRGKRIGALLTLEGAEPINDLAMLRLFYSLGIRGIGLTWNQRNLLADGIGVGQGAGGLTQFGRRVVREMNKSGILVDAAHISRQGFFDLMTVSQAPILVTHANAAAICRHRRNLDDEQLKALQAHQGLVGLSFYPDFVAETGEADLEKLLDHFVYIAHHFGTDILGLGSDYDGIPAVVKGLENVSSLPHLTEGLWRRGFAAKEIQMILGGNYLRVMQTVLKREADDNNVHSG